MMPLRKILLAVILGGVASDAHAQGCAMCLASAMSQGYKAMHAMNLGILVLIIPPVLMIIGILTFTFLRRP